MRARFTWFGHFAVRIAFPGGSLFIDPFRIREKRAEPADLVLLTSPRLGHLSPEDLARVRKEGTIVAGPPDAIREVEGGRALTPGETLEAAGARIRAVPAYNRMLSFFPRGRGWLGYLVEAGGRSFYHAGATDLVPEMGGIRAEVAFLPVSGRIVMGPEEARRAAEIVGARVAVPLHLVGERFRKPPGFVTSE